MKPDYAFEFKDLAVLLALKLTEPADQADIEATPPSSTAAAVPTLPARGARRPVPADTPPGSRLPALSPSPADGGLIIEVPEGPP